MKNKIPTAKEFILNNSGCRKVMMIEFAKLHVEMALKEASEKANTKTEYWVNLGGDHEETTVDKQSILNAYPLTNIK